MQTDSENEANLNAWENEQKDLFFEEYLQGDANYLASSEKDWLDFGIWLMEEVGIANAQACLDAADSSCMGAGHG